MGGTGIRELTMLGRFGLPQKFRQIEKIAGAYEYINFGHRGA